MPVSNKKTRRRGEASEDLPSERLSPGTENYLLCLYRMWEDSQVPTITQLTDSLKKLPQTEGLGTSLPSVAGMIRRMQRQVLVDLGTDKKIRLTDKGLEGGVNIARRHRLAEWLVVGRHALKNAFLPVITIIGWQFGRVISGTVIIETIFLVPGMGRLLIDSILHRDYTTIQGLVVLVTLLVMLVNLTVDLLYAWLDPRIRYA